MTGESRSPDSPGTRSIPLDELTDEELDRRLADASSPERVTSRRRARIIVAAVLAGLLLLLGGIGIGRLTAPNPPLMPSTRSAEAGFARDMQTHHRQAVQMALIIYQKTSDPDIRSLAYDIATSQQQQAGQMYGWLSTWGLSQAAPEPSMTWMTRPALDGASGDHRDMNMGSDVEAGGTMPGLATQDQIDELEAASVADADRLFLTLMIAHHTGGIEMANAVLERTTNPVVTALANGIVFVQQSDIDYMNELLAR